MIIKKEKGNFRRLTSFAFTIFCVLVLILLVFWAFSVKLEKPISGEIIDEDDEEVSSPEISEDKIPNGKTPEIKRELLNFDSTIGNESNQTNQIKKTSRRAGSGGGNSGDSSQAEIIPIELNTGNSSEGNSSENNSEINMTIPSNQSNGTSNETNAPDLGGNQSSNESVNVGNPENSGGNHNNEKKGKLKNIRNSLKIKSNNQELIGSEEFRGRNRFNLEKGTGKIADFDVDFDGDLDLANLVADVDFTSGKAFMHNPEKILKNITLYIPRLPGQDGVLICSNASSFGEIYIGCGNDSEVTGEYILQIGHEDLKISEDGNYFLVTGITGTGGNGVNVSAGPPQTAPADPAGNNSAFAGNITYLSVTGFSTTRAWQGYFGNVSGTIELGDASGNVLYNWSVAEPEGEVYASTNSSLSWTSLQCFNFTANGTQSTNGETFGATSLSGLNLSGLEGRFNVASEDVDGVNETFSLTPGGDGHDQFFIANLQFSAGECLSAKTFISGGGQGSNQFEEVLLWDPSTSSVVFTAILEEGTLNGFNNQDNDFQMLVLEDGHGTNVLSTTYFFFAELQ